MSKTRRHRLDGPYDLRQTLLTGDYGRHHPCVQLFGDDPRTVTLHQATHAQTPHASEGPVSFRVQVRAADGEVAAEAWGPGADWFLESMPLLLGLDDRPPALGGRLGRLQRRVPGVRQGRAPNVFELLVHTVIRQRVAWRDAVTTQREILRAHGQPAPGPLGLTLPLAPAQWHGLSATDLAVTGLERKRARTILEVAARARHIAEWSTLAPAEFAAKIELLPGIGPWTSATVRAMGLGDVDAVPVGDYDLPSLVSWVLADEPRADDARMLELLAPWAGMRFRVVHQLWASGITAPRFGPRIRGQRPR